MKIKTGSAILIGHLLITIPVLLIILLFYILITNWVGFLIGFVVAWFYWSLLIPKWRKWALRKNVNADELQKWGQLTGLVWKKGSIFEKTEIENNNNENNNNK